MPNTGWIWNPEATSAHCNLDAHECRVWRGDADNEWHFSVKPTGRLGMTTNGESYSAESAIERAEKCVAKGTFRVKAHAIVKELGTGWKMETPKGDDSIFDNRVEFVGPDGAKLYLSVDGYRNLGKVHVSARHQNHDAHKHVPYKESFPSINVSSSKTAAQIAADIKRRVFPGMVALLAKVNEGITAAAAYVDTTDKTAYDLAVAIGGGVEDLDKYSSNKNRRIVRAHAAGDDFRFEVTGERIEFPSMVVDATEAAAILKTLAKLRGGKVGK